MLFNTVCDIIDTSVKVCHLIISLMSRNLWFFFSMGMTTHKRTIKIKITPPGSSISSWGHTRGSPGSVFVCCTCPRLHKHAFSLTFSESLAQPQTQETDLNNRKFLLIAVTSPDKTNGPLVCICVCLCRPYNARTRDPEGLQVYVINWSFLLQQLSHRDWQRENRKCSPALTSLLIWLSCSPTVNPYLARILLIIKR